MVAAFRMAIFVHRSVLLSNWDDLRAVFLGSGYMTHPSKHVSMPLRHLIHLKIDNRSRCRKKVDSIFHLICPYSHRPKEEINEKRNCTEKAMAELKSLGKRCNEKRCYLIGSLHWSG